MKSVRKQVRKQVVDRARQIRAHQVQTHLVEERMRVMVASRIWIPVRAQLEGPK